MFGECLRGLEHGFLGVPAGVYVDSRSLTALSPQELVQRQAGALRFNVPQRHIDAGDRVVEDGPVAPIGVVRGNVPDILDTVGIPPLEERMQVFIDGHLHRPGALGERGASPTIETRFRCIHAYEHQ